MLNTFSLVFLRKTQYSFSFANYIRSSLFYWHFTLTHVELCIFHPCNMHFSKEIVLKWLCECIWEEKQLMVCTSLHSFAALLLVVNLSFTVKARVKPGNSSSSWQHIKKKPNKNDFPSNSQENLHLVFKNLKMLINCFGFWFEWK